MSLMSWDSYNKAALDGDDDGDEDWIDRAVANGMGFKSNEERQRYIDSIGDPLAHPLFAGSAEDMKDHPLANAFDCLKEEGRSNLENAIIFKDEGNMFVKVGYSKFDAARSKYKYALEYILKAENEYSESNSEIDKTKVYDIKTQIYSNLALVELQSKNYRQCIEYANEVIYNIPGTNSIKAHFRKCKALQSLKRYNKAIAACTEALSAVESIAGSYSEVDAEKSKQEIMSIMSLCKQEVEAQLQTLVRNTNMLIEANKQLEAKYADAWDICQKHGIKVGLGALNHPSQLNPSFPFYESINGVANKQECCFPILLLYPQYNTFDIISGSCSSLVCYRACISMCGGM